MLKNVKKLKDYRKVCKQLGWVYKEAHIPEEYEMKEYGLKVVENLLKSEKAILEDNKLIIKLISDWSNVEILSTTKAIVIIIENKVFGKKKDGQIYEIEELKGYEYLNTMEGVPIFSLKQDYIGISMKSLETFKLGRGILQGLFYLQYIQIHLCNKRAFKLYIVENGEIFESKWLLRYPFKDESRYQLNYDVKEEKWKVFYTTVSKIEDIATYDYAEKDWANNEFVLVGTESKSEILQLGRKLRKFPIMGRNIEIMIADGITFCKTKEEGKVHLYQFTGDEFKLVETYEARDIIFEPPVFDKKDPSYKYKLTVIK